MSLSLAISRHLSASPGGLTIATLSLCIATLMLIPFDAGGLAPYAVTSPLGLLIHAPAPEDETGGAPERSETPGIERARCATGTQEPEASCAVQG